MISIIVPVYNAEKYVSECIESILNQSYSNLELLLVDDGSKDASYAVCRQYAEKDSRIRLLKKENGGVSSARNYGLDQARGDYIGFVDADDIIHPQMYELLYKALESRQADAAYCNYYSFADSLYEKEIAIEQPRIKIISKGELFFNFYSTYDVPYVSCCTKLISSRLLEKIRFDNHLAYGEDNLVAMQCFYAAQQVVYVDLCLYYYRDNKTSVTNNGWTLKALDSIRAYFYSYHFWIDNHEEKFAGYAITKAYKVMLAMWAMLPKTIYYDEAIKILQEMYKENYEDMRMSQYVTRKNKTIFAVAVRHLKLLKFYICLKNLRR